jgi:hypothetical protein
VLQPYLMKRSNRVPIWALILAPIVLGLIIPFWGVLLAPPLRAMIYAFRRSGCRSLLVTIDFRLRSLKNRSRKCGSQPRFTLVP